MWGLLLMIYDKQKKKKDLCSLIRICLDAEFMNGFGCCFDRGTDVDKFKSIDGFNLLVKLYVCVHQPFFK